MLLLMISTNYIPELIKMITLLLPILIINVDALTILTVYEDFTCIDE
jgi:hypothetical protein